MQLGRQACSTQPALLDLVFDAISNAMHALSAAAAGVLDVNSSIYLLPSQGTMQACLMGAIAMNV